MTNEQRRIAEKLSKGDVTLAYAYVTPLSKDRRDIYVFELNAKNIANFLGKNQFVDNIIITDVLDNFVLDTFGGFINRCASQELNREILNTLIPIQTGEAESEDIEVIPLQIMDELWDE